MKSQNKSPLLVTWGARVLVMFWLDGFFTFSLFKSFSSACVGAGTGYGVEVVWLLLSGCAFRCQFILFVLFFSACFFVSVFDFLYSTMSLSSERDGSSLGCMTWVSGLVDKIFVGL